MLRTSPIPSRPEGRGIPGGIPMTALAGHAFLPAPSLTKLMDRLVDQNLVYRRIDPADRRRVLARLTPRGMQRWQSMAREVRSDWRDLDHLLASEELRHLLAQLAEALEGRFTTVAGRLTTGRAAKAVKRAH
ncbi:MarR family winged helix-turn-helix transcriptional regulator [Streptomyces sp. NPDC059378]|uniref:MarR family winged helix-turn-helix transcriptional regulator n=1 Tax=Streptomyces sp. NPDC059378 TaxID=3346815 RepID=UPI0036999E2E